MTRRLTHEERERARIARLDEQPAESPLVKFARVWNVPSTAKQPEDPADDSAPTS